MSDVHGRTVGLGTSRLVQLAPHGLVWLRGDAAVFVKQAAVTDTHLDQERKGEATRWLQCLHCNHNITRTSDRIDVDGKHEFSFINPTGVIYRIGCFGQASGVNEVGEPSGHFTWFAGYVWRIVLCLGCGQHLGWKFSSDDSQFFGLVLTELKVA